jgi:hypothetical protein
MRSKIKMPKEITTLQEFLSWIRNPNIEVRMKRRSYYPDDFTQIGNKIHYLISDGKSRGVCELKNFNKVFDFIYES